MFKDDEVNKIIDNLDTDNLDSSRLKYILNKIKKYTPLQISLSELNYLYSLTDKKVKYNISAFKYKLKDANIGYTSIIKNVGIPKSTLSKLLNNERNVKLTQVNEFITKINKIYGLKLSKEMLIEGE